MDDPTSQDPRHGEQVAGDYHPRRAEQPDLDNSDHARLRRASAVLQEGRHAGDDDGFGLGACARLLAVIAEVRSRDVEIDPDVLATAMAISAHVLELGPRS